jgi:hypothetical protein
MIATHTRKSMGNFEAALKLRSDRKASTITPAVKSQIPFINDFDMVHLVAGNMIS